MRKTRHILPLALAALAFTACTQDDISSPLGGVEGAEPLKLTAAIEDGAATRASVDNYWDEGEKVALKVDGDDKTYTYITEGLWGENLFGDYYWKGTAPITVQGFYPFEAAAVTEWKVESQQDIEENYQGGDLLVSQKESVSFGDNASLTFYHQTAKVVVNVKQQGLLFEGWEDATITLDIGSDLTLNGTFTPPTGADANGRWIGTWIPGSKKGNITPCEVENADGCVATYEALVIPQDVSAGTQLLTFNVTKGGIHYGPLRYTLENDITWKPGYEYTYDINIFHYGLEVQVTESIDWNTSNTGSGNLSLQDKYDPNTKTYYAYTADGLKDWAEKVKSGDVGPDAKCLLFDDIDFGGEEWTPVGSFDDGFTGTFDGQGHTISNMTIAGSEYAGLFAYIEKGGKVQNVEFKNIEIPRNENNQYVGVVAGYNDGIIAHCQITDGTAYINNTTGSIGGIAGQNEGTISCCEVVDCILNGNQKSAYVGGIAGLNSVEGQIEACSFTDVIYAANYGGGIVGQNDGDIKACWADANFAGSGNKGGVCGKLNSGTITACYWQSSIGADKGVGSNTDGTDNTVKVEGETTWQTAADDMNEELGTDFGWHWQTSDSGTPPTLVQR